jgi:hypothetical protein
MQKVLKNSAFFYLFLVFNPNHFFCCSLIPTRTSVLHNCSCDKQVLNQATALPLINELVA